MAEVKGIPLSELTEVTDISGVYVFASKKLSDNSYMSGKLLLSNYSQIYDCSKNGEIFDTKEKARASVPQELRSVNRLICYSCNGEGFILEMFSAPNVEEYWDTDPLAWVQLNGGFPSGGYEGTAQDLYNMIGDIDKILSNIIGL